MAVRCSLASLSDRNIERLLAATIRGWLDEAPPRT
jgi:hypothetical protein